MYRYSLTRLTRDDRKSFIAFYQEKKISANQNRQYLHEENEFHYVILYYAYS